MTKELEFIEDINSKPIKIGDNISVHPANVAIATGIQRCTHGVCYAEVICTLSETKYNLLLKEIKTNDYVLVLNKKNKNLYYFFKTTRKLNYD